MHHSFFCRLFVFIVNVVSLVSSICNVFEPQHPPISNQQYPQSNVCAKPERQLVAAAKLQKTMNRSLREYFTLELVPMVHIIGFKNRTDSPL